MKVFLLCLIFQLFAFFYCDGQRKYVSPIRIGDMIPELEIESIVNYRVEKAKISDFAGKLVIFDFWATWCSPCIKAFPKLDSLQREFKDFIQILAVTGEDKEVVSDFLARMEKINGILPATITNDVLLSKYFPHIYLPHYVWIDKHGKLLAITNEGSVHRDNIIAVLNGTNPSFTFVDNPIRILDKTYLNIQVFQPSYEWNYVGDETTQLNQLSDTSIIINSLLTRYIEGLPGGTRADSTLISVKNLPIIWFFRVALWKHGIEMLNQTKTISVVEDRKLNEQITGVVDGHYLSGLQYLSWIREYGFCYELRVPLEFINFKFDIMLDELNRYFGNLYGIFGQIEKRKEKYLALRRISNLIDISTKNTEPKIEQDKFKLKLQNHSLSELVSNLLIPLQKYPLIIDETGFLSNVDLELNCQLSDLVEVNRELKRYGLQLVQKRKRMDVGVIRSKKRTIY